MRMGPRKNGVFVGKGGAAERMSPAAERRGEESGACADAGAPSEVTQKQLDELHIAVTAKEE